MPTEKRRINLAVTDAMFRKIMDHRNKRDGMSMAEATLDLVLKGLIADGIEITSLEGYEDLRRKVDEDIRRAAERQAASKNPER